VRPEPATKRDRKHEGLGAPTKVISLVKGRHKTRTDSNPRRRRGKEGVWKVLILPKTRSQGGIKEFHAKK